MNIDAQRLKELRLRPGKRLSQEQLAERSKLSKRQIQRLESGSASKKTVHEGTVVRLAEALSVEVGVLTGDLPNPKEGNGLRRREADPIQKSARITPEANLAYALIGRRYGVTATTIMNMAPLFFALLAEGSLNWRREMLRELDEASERMNEIGRAAGHLAYTNWIAHVTEAAAEDDESIEEADLFGRRILGNDFGFDPATENPLADYLRKLAADLDRPSIIEVDPDGDKELGDGAIENFPRYRICKSELERITGGSDCAAWALERGHARLSQIPEELRGEDATEERKKWLEDRVPDDERFLFFSPALPDVLSTTSRGEHGK